MSTIIDPYQTHLPADFVYPQTPEEEAAFRAEHRILPGVSLRPPRPAEFDPETYWGYPDFRNMYGTYIGEVPSDEEVVVPVSTEEEKKPEKEVFACGVRKGLFWIVLGVMVTLLVAALVPAGYFMVMGARESAVVSGDGVMRNGTVGNETDVRMGTPTTTAAVGRQTPVGLPYKLDTGTWELEVVPEFYTCKEEPLAICGMPFNFRFTIEGGHPGYTVDVGLWGLRETALSTPSSEGGYYGAKWETTTKVVMDAGCTSTEYVDLWMSKDKTVWVEQ